MNLDEARELLFLSRFKIEVICRLERIEHKIDGLTSLLERQPIGVKFVFPVTKQSINELLGENKMADVSLKQGQSVPVELHYVDASGNDLGVVPASDSPSISVDQPAELGLSITGGQGTATNTNTGSAAVTVTLTGSAKGFTATATIDCAGAAPPPPAPTGVKFVFGTPTP